MAMVAFSTAAAFYMHLLWAEGGIPWVGEGYAHAEQLNAIQSDMKVARIRDLITDILNTRKNQCKATGPLHDVLTQQITEMTIEYQHLNNSPFPVPSCSEIE